MTFNFSLAYLQSQTINNGQPVVPSQVFTASSQPLTQPVIVPSQCKPTPLEPYLTLTPIVKSQALRNFTPSWRCPEVAFKSRSTVVDPSRPISAHSRAYRVLQQRMAYRHLLSQSDTRSSMGILLGYPFPPIQQQQQGHNFICLWERCEKRERMTMENLIEHVHVEHIGTGKTIYQCFWKNCSRNLKPFNKRHKMHDHFRVHTGERPFICNYSGCLKRFARQETLSKHLKTHLGSLTFTCLECTKTYHPTCFTNKGNEVDIQTPRL